MNLLQRVLLRPLSGAFSDGVVRDVTNDTKKRDTRGFDALPANHGEKGRASRLGAVQGTRMMSSGEVVSLLDARIASAKLEREHYIDAEIATHRAKSEQQTAHKKALEQVLLDGNGLKLLELNAASRGKAPAVGDSQLVKIDDESFAHSYYMVRFASEPVLRFCYHGRDGSGFYEASADDLSFTKEDDLARSLRGLVDDATAIGHR